ncbi:MAG: MBL fold metallo-hydrolase, partial [Bacteroidota bacterium]|nr:MBL fold metallo-hydrolase [Bacteroidota bacterium]
STKTNLLTLDPEKDVLVWFGHSSYFMQIDGKKILVDPVFSGHASPFSFMVKSFEGSDVYTPEDFLEIDYLFITHDHWGKFALALHAWDDPIERVTTEARRLNVPIVHPMIGEEVNLNEFGVQSEWWKSIN